MMRGLGFVVGGFLVGKGWMEILVCVEVVPVFFGVAKGTVDEWGTREGRGKFIERDANE